MTPEQTTQWRQADRVLQDLLDYPPAQRIGQLEQLALQPAVTSKAIRLLQAVATENSPVDLGIGPALGGLPAAQPAELTGRTCGDWVLESEIGRGGMAIVYRAHRDTAEFTQTAALKVLGASQIGSEGQFRFEREKRILAGLSHPHIAALLDAGVTGDGTPFIAMEYVDGERIDDYVEGERLSDNGRVRLFLAVCQAVAFAQQSLIVHRDLKPSNILVDVHGQVKLLDFGIARLLAEQDPDSTTTRAFTPGYCAPEQLSGGHITTATDVFALGAVLYGLLTGRRAFDDSLSPGYQKPSEPVHLNRAMDRDLSNIVMMALREETERRYPSAQAFSQDLEAWLQNKPVLATPDTARYRVSKFIRRHRIAALATALVLIVGVAGLIATRWQAERAVQAAATAVHERQATEATVEFLISLFVQANPEVTGGIELSAREILDLGSARLNSSLTGQPGIRARLLQTIGEVYLGTGLYERAADHSEAALAIDDLPDSIRGKALLGLGRAQLALTDLDAASITLDRADGLLKEGASRADLLRTRGMLQSARADFSGAESSLRQALALNRARAAEEAVILRDLMALGEHFVNTADFDQADAALTEALELATVINLPAQRARVLNQLAHLQSERGQFELALGLITEARAALAKTYGEHHPVLVIGYLEQASILRALNRLDEAQQHAETALAIARDTLGDHHHTSGALNMLGVLAFDRQQLEQAIEFTREATEMSARVIGSEEPDIAVLRTNLAAMYRMNGQIDEAEEQVEIAYRIHTTKLEPTHPDMLHTRAHMAHMHRLRGRLAEAEQEYRRMASDATTTLGPNNPLTIAGNSNVGTLLLSSGRNADEAAQFLERAFASAQATYPGDSTQVISIQLSLAQARIAQGRLKEASALLERFSGQPDQSANEWAQGRALVVIALLREAQGDHDTARQWVDAALLRFDQAPDRGVRYRATAEALQERLGPE